MQEYEEKKSEEVLEQNAADEKAIIPFTSKKTYTTKTLQGFIKENTKDWFNEDDADSKKEIQQFLWNSAL